MPEDKTIKFAEDFPKLKDDFFTTIRPTNKSYDIARRYKIKTPTEEFAAILTNSQCVRLIEIPEYILTYDCNTQTKEEAIKIIQSFYPYLKGIDLVQLLSFARLKGPYPHKGWVWCEDCGVPFRPGIGDTVYMRFQGHKPRGKCRFCAAQEEEGLIS